MLINWVQFKHSYLLGAMLFLSLVLLSNYTQINHFLVLIVLVGHAILAIRSGTAAYVMDLLFGERIRIEPYVLNPNDRNLSNLHEMSSYMSGSAPF
jgi:hypothetical protein